MSKNKNKTNKHDSETAQQQMNEVKTDVEAVTQSNDRSEILAQRYNVVEAQTNKAEFTNDILELKDYTNEELAELTQTSILQDYLSFKKDFVKQISDVHTEFKDYSLSELVSYALKQTFNITNLNAKMLERSYHNRQNASDRINNVVKERRVKTDKTLVSKEFDILASKFSELAKASNLNENELIEKLNANVLIKDRNDKETLIKAVCANVYAKL
jgi:hypothetical protein